MKQISYILLLFLPFLSCDESNQHTPKPTQVYQGQEEGNFSSREDWFDELHAVAPGVDWKAIETENQKDIAALKQELREASFLRDEIEIGSGFLTGEWKERGSKNQAGSIVITTYDKTTDQVYAVSAGGTLWKGPLDGDSWEVLNQDIRFGRSLLEVVYVDEDNRTLLASIGGTPHYSTDEGKTWTISNIKTSSIIHAVKLSDDRILVLAIRASDRYVRLYESDDFGRTYSIVHYFNTQDKDDVDFFHDPAHDKVVVVEKIDSESSRIFTYDKENSDLIKHQDASPTNFMNADANITSHIINDTLKLYIYNGDKKVYTSVDTGATWNFLDELEKNPWNIGLYATNYKDSKTVFMGEVECWRLNTSGKFSKINNWYDYYNNVAYMLHADIMYIEEYLDSDDRPFILISNHGGISKSYDNGLINTNISLSTLNVGQFYDVRSLPGEEDFIIGGTQDQGLQRGIGNPDKIIDLEQVISGDYGHIVFTKKSNHMATVYPYGAVSYYTFPKNGYADLWYDIPNPENQVWIPPIEASPYDEDAIFMAGGSEQDDEGSRLLKMSYNNGAFDVEEFEHNFNTTGNESISAIAFNHFNPKKIYVATRKGSFWRSEDGGLTFEKTDGGLSGSHYLYGSCILPSKVDSNLIYLSGSGYTFASVFRSTDGGDYFEPYDQGIPRTTAFNVVANKDENVLYAATEIGPYVRYTEEDKWVYLGGTDAPNTRFWSVEYVEDKDIARFGTYGRGIWDFQVIKQPVATQEVDNNESSFSVFPNPARDYINLNIPSGKTATRVEITNLEGRQVKQCINQDKSLNVSDLNTGIYFITLYIDNQKSTRKLVKL